MRDIRVFDIGAIDGREAALRDLPGRVGDDRLDVPLERLCEFSPRPEKTLMPLSSNGLCDALMTSPASKPNARVM